MSRYFRITCSFFDEAAAGDKKKRDCAGIATCDDCELRYCKHAKRIHAHVHQFSTTTESSEESSDLSSGSSATDESSGDESSSDEASPKRSKKE